MSEIKVLIVEDETSAVNRLKKELAQIKELGFSILGNTTSIKETVNWLMGEETPDLIFMDIQLTDGLSLEVFKLIDVPCPVIFTTAFDEYALQAFKLNSIDYLLKPIDSDDLATAIEKFQKQKQSFGVELYMEQIKNLTSKLAPANYRSSFLVSFRQKMMMVDIQDVAYMYIKERGVFIKKKDGVEYILEYFLDDLEKQLDPAKFYRANRQFLVARSAISEIEPYFNGRLVISVNPPAHTPVIISKEKATHFKRWADY